MLPTFRYHPDPIVTGSIEPSDERCVACGRARGYTYAGPVYTEGELDGPLCPWCIADGSAAKKFDADFIDLWSEAGALPGPVFDELAHRTPGYHSWQQGSWLFHCGDGCAFLGEVGQPDLAAYADALDVIRQECKGIGWPDAAVDEFLASITKGGSPTAYLFRCLVCGVHLAYADFD